MKDTGASGTWTAARVAVIGLFVFVATGRGGASGDLQSPSAVVSMTEKKVITYGVFHGDAHPPHASSLKYRCVVNDHGLSLNAFTSETRVALIVNGVVYLDLTLSDDAKYVPGARRVRFSIGPSSDRDRVRVAWNEKKIVFERRGRSPLYADQFVESGGISTIDEPFSASFTFGSLEFLFAGRLTGKLGGHGRTVSSVVKSVLYPAVPLDHVVSIAGGPSHFFALKADGTLWAQGDQAGRLGTSRLYDSIPDDCSEPGYFALGEAQYAAAPVAGLTEVVSVRSTDTWSAAVRADGTVWAWGKTPFSACRGQGTARAIDGLNAIASVAVGELHLVAIGSDGNVWEWGYAGESRYVPTQVSGVSAATAASAGSNFSMVLLGDGTVWSWGDNYFGQLGNGTDEDRFVPGQIQGLSGVVAVQASGSMAVALRSDGTVWAWGGTTGGGTTPQQVPGLSGVVAIDGAVAWRDDGSVVRWARDGLGAWVVGPFEIPGVVGVHEGIYQSAYLMEDGRVWFGPGDMSSPIQQAFSEPP